MLKKHCTLTKGMDFKLAERMVLDFEEYEDFIDDLIKNKVNQQQWSESIEDADDLDYWQLSFCGRAAPETPERY